jgi:hypothetical protein
VLQEAGRLAHRTAEAGPDSEPVRGFLFVYELPAELSVDTQALQPHWHDQQLTVRRAL